MDTDLQALIAEILKWWDKHEHDCAGDFTYYVYYETPRFVMQAQELAGVPISTLKKNE